MDFKLDKSHLLQQELFRRELRHGIVQHGPDVGQRRYRHGRPRRIAPFIRHQQSGVYGGVEGGIVMALIEKSPLVGGGFWGQRHPQKAAYGPQNAPQTLQKRGVGPGEIAGQILKVHIHPGKTFDADRIRDLGQQCCLHGPIG